MNKLPAKQIYLLSIIIGGLMALSVYSTYSIFTLESETSDVVSLHTPNTLNVSTSMYEYKRVTAKKNDLTTIDFDLYNANETDICYSIWYQIATKNTEEEKIAIYQKTDETLTTSSTVEPVGSKRISLVIINDSDKDVVVNLGITSSINEGTCQLNIDSSRKTITSTISSTNKLSDNIIKNIDKSVSQEAGYLTYKNIEEELTITTDIKIAKSYKYKDEIFTLEDPLTIEPAKISEYTSDDFETYYTCLTDEECEVLYKINKTKTENNQYKITNYDKYIGYLKGDSGIRKINQFNQNLYYYYGDNPNNFIYYNCQDAPDTKTCELWRIIGLVPDEDDNYLIKIIKDEPLSDKLSYSTETNNLWSSSTLNKYLNKDYKLSDTKYLTEVNVLGENILSENTDLSIIETIETKDKEVVSLLSVSDYLHTSICQKQKIGEYDEECFKNNWLNISKNNTLEWTISSYHENDTTNELGELIKAPNNTAYSVGDSLKLMPIETELQVRPVVYLKSRILLFSGTGTFEDPYIIK